MACGDNYINGDIGGEAEHTLTVDEIPAHSHGQTYSEEANGEKDIKWLGTHGSGSNIAYGVVETGGSQPHNNMPPYLAVFMWKRVK